MTRSQDKYFRTMTRAELWKRYCGFLDLSIDEFMTIQEELLMDQVSRVAETPLGKKIIGDVTPKNPAEFREIVPLTSHADYEPYMSDRTESALAEKPVFWCHSSGVGGRFKWMPYMKEALDAGVEAFMSILILASARRKGDVNVFPGERVLLHMAPKPYASGASLEYTDKFGFTMRVLPSIEEAEKMEFPDRIAKGFQLALLNGVDEIFSITSVLAKVGKEMATHARKVKFSPFLLHPAVMFRLARGGIRSMVARRAMLPKDLWQPKSILAIGTDTEIYKEDINYYWGQIPYEIYGGTEVFPIAIQAWNKKCLAFLPNAAFYEFIPEEESKKSNDDPSYRPETLLLNELQAGKNYEIVVTQFRGMPFLRYKLGDVISIRTISDEETGIRVPQMTFKCRADEIIHLAGLAKLDEKMIWQAIANTGMKYSEWTARKETDAGEVFLHIYVETDGVRDTAHDLENLIDLNLRTIDTDYRDIGSLLGQQPVRITLLSRGTFERYAQEKRLAGADLAHMKPRHINPPHEVVQRLIKLSGEKT